MKGTVFAASLFAFAAQAQSKIPLASLLERTAEQNPAIQIARLKTLELEVQAKIASSAWEPQMHLRVTQAVMTYNLATIGLEIPGLAARQGPFRYFDARPVVSKTIFDKSLLTTIQAARERIELAKLETETVREASMFAVTELYIRILEIDSRLAASAARTKTAEAVKDVTRKRLEAGAATRLELESAQQQVHSEALLRISLERDRATLRTLMAQTSGSDQLDFEVETIAPGPPVAITEEEALAKAVSQRSDLRVMGVMAKVAGLERDAARREKLPKVTAMGDYGVIGAGPDRSLSTFTVGATASMPLWTGRRLENQAAAAELRKREAELEERRRKLAIVQQIRQALVEAQTAQLALLEANRAKATATEVYSLSRARYEGGLATNLPVVIAQGEIAQAEDHEIRSRYQLLLSQARLAHATGDVRAFLRK
jgi:outer membrane protein TolC